MLSIGWPELMVVAAAALIIVGPRDLPALLRNIGQVMGRVRRMSNEFRSEINKVAALDDVKNIHKSITAPLEESRASIESEFNKVGKSGVSPSGKMTPTDPKVESVYDRIKQQTGDIKAPDAGEDPITAAIARSREPVIKATPAKAKTTRRPKSTIAKSTTAKSAVAKKTPVRKAPAKSAKPKTAASETAAKKTVSAKPIAKPKATAKPKLAAKSKTPAKPKSVKSAPIKTAAEKPAAKKTAAKPRAPRKQPASKA